MTYFLAWDLFTWLLIIIALLKCEETHSPRTTAQENPEFFWKGNITEDHILAKTGHVSIHVWTRMSVFSKEKNDMDKIRSRRVVCSKLPPGPFSHILLQTAFASCGAERIPDANSLSRRRCHHVAPNLVVLLWGTHYSPLAFQSAIVGEGGGLCDSTGAHGLASIVSQCPSRR